MPFDSQFKTGRPSLRGALVRLLMGLPAWIYIALAVGGLAIAVAVSLSRGG